MAISGIEGAVAIGGSPLAFTHEALSTTDFKNYTIANAVKSTWLGTLIPTIETSADGTTWVPVTSGYKVYSLLGAISFVAEQSHTLLVRATGQYVPTTIVANATNWDFSIDLDTVDSTKFRSEWKTSVPTVKGGSGTFSQFYKDSYFVQALGGPLIIILYVDETSGYKGLGQLKSDAIKSKVDDIVGEDIGFDISGAVVSFPLV